MTHVLPRADVTTGRRHKAGLGGVWWWLNPRHHPRIGWVVLAISLVITAVAWRIAEDFVWRNAQDRFGFEIHDIKVSIEKRMLDQEIVLRGGVGLFASSDHVSREEWATFVDTLEINLYFPGLQGFGFSLQVPPEDLDSHTAAIRAEGFEDYAIRPEGVRDTYTSIIYLEPFDWRNQRAFGFDMFSEPTRRAAMERARDSGQAAVSGAVTLVQETETDVQRGFLMYLPVYRSGAPTDTVQQRRDALIGYVYSPFRMADLMRGILGVGRQNISYRIFDDGKATDDGLLYASGDGNAAEPWSDRPAFQSSEVLTTGGRQWLLQFEADSDYVPLAERGQPLFIVAGGLLIDFLVFAVIGAIYRQRQRATEIAETMTIELRDQTKRTQAIVDTILDSIVIVDATGTIVSCNPATEDIFGHRPQDIIGAHLTMLIPDPDRYLTDYLYAEQMTVIANDCEVLGRRRSGALFAIDLSLSPMTINGKTQFTAVMRDISERKRNEKLKNEFIAIVSHELRTPLTSLIGSLALVQTGALGPIPDKVNNLVSIAYRNSRRLAVIVNDILSIEKIEAGHLDFKFGYTEIVALFREALTECQSYADEFDVRFVYEPEMDKAYVRADGARLVQVMANLLSNAAKFSPRGGEIRIRLSRAGEVIRVSVSDKGPGIPADQHDRVFEKFSQIDSSDTRHRQGSGLGLNISQAIIENHDSRIQLVSEVGKGATFFFDLFELSALEEEDEAASRPRQAISAGN
ncbi:MAG: CHASE domain-containing sensor histidine kinase [Inquilinaceae bacterium]